MAGTADGCPDDVRTVSGYEEPGVVGIGASGAGKTTLTDALYLVHPGSHFPVLPRYGSATLASEGSSRAIEVAYKLADSLTEEGRFGRQLHAVGHQRLGEVTQSRGVALSHKLGSVAAKANAAHGRSLDLDPYKLIHLPTWRHPLDELARREARILVKLLRAEQQRLNGTRNLVGLRARASELLEELAKERIIDTVEARIRGYMTDLLAGVSASGRTYAARSSTTPASPVCWSSCLP